MFLPAPSLRLPQPLDEEPDAGVHGHCARGLFQLRLLDARQVPAELGQPGVLGGHHVAVELLQHRAVLGRDQHGGELDDLGWRRRSAELEGRQPRINYFIAENAYRLGINAINCFCSHFSSFFSLRWKSNSVMSALGSEKE